MSLRSCLATAALFAVAASAHAGIITGTYGVTVSEGVTNGSGFDTASGNPFSCTGSNVACAAFTYTGALNFDNTAAQNNPGPGGDLNSAFGFTSGSISGYSATDTTPHTVVYNSQTVANFGNKANFLTSSGSAGSYAYGSYYTFDLGTIAAGTELSITHDDGVSLFENGMQIGDTVSGPTSQTTDLVNVIETGDVTLRYARENGTPSILQVSAVTPEPSSIALLGTGFLGLAGMVRRRLA